LKGAKKQISPLKSSKVLRKLVQQNRNKMISLFWTFSFGITVQYI